MHYPAYKADLLKLLQYIKANFGKTWELDYNYCILSTDNSKGGKDVVIFDEPREVYEYLVLQTS